MDGNSLTPKEEKLNALRQILPEAFAEGKIDWEKLRATLGEDINFNNERYVLNWAGKSDAFKVLQEPTKKTLVPAKSESVNFDATDNIFIEGENLEVLKVLQKSYFGKVKMIYIDPPYNTGNDSFIYPDKFSETIEEYKKRVGDKDEDGYMTKDGRFHKNSKENGQYHSNWLNMMMPRLYLAKNLLRQDGVIFVSIDDNEVHNLRLLMNEILGEENFVANFIWQHRKSSQNDVDVSLSHNYTLAFAKNRDIFKLNSLTINEDKFTNQDNDVNGDWVADPMDAPGIRENLSYKITNPNTAEIFLPPNGRHWRFTKEKYEEAVKQGRIVFGKTGKSKPQYKRYKSEAVKKGTNPFTIWTDLGTATEGTQELMRVFNGEKYFDTPKPKKLLKEILVLSTNLNDLILDFFAGSGTTAHAVMELNKEDGGNRKYICVQLPELCDENSEAYKAGYKTIADISKERIRRASRKIQLETDAANEKQKGKLEFAQTVETNVDLGFKVMKLAESNFKQWESNLNNDTKRLAEQMELFIDPVAENAKIENIAYELLLKGGKELTSKIEKKESYYVINDNELILMLESATQADIDKVINEKPTKVIALDRLFTGNDQLKTNTVLQMRDAEIEFKTI